MTFERYSAAEVFGVPMDEGRQPETSEELIGLMEAYNIEGRELPPEPTDITPYYWQKPAFRYFLSLAHPEGPAVVDLMPVHADSEAFSITRLGRLPVGIAIPGVRRLEIPTDQHVMVIAGKSPRFAGHICIHEIVAYRD